MIKYEDALKIAKEKKEVIDYCVEYDIAYMFCANADRYSIGGDSAIIILKENGEDLNPLYFYDEYSNAKEVKTFNVKDIEEMNPVKENRNKNKIYKIAS